MACTQEYINYVLEQCAPAGEVVANKMFGEYGLYLDGKIIGLVCDNQVFLKKTESGARLLGENAVEGYAYPGAKPSYVFEDLDDQDFLVELLRATWQELPAPKPKKPRATRKQ